MLEDLTTLVVALHVSVFKSNKSKNILTICSKVQKKVLVSFETSLVFISFAVVTLSL